MGKIIKTKTGYKTRVYLGEIQVGIDETGRPVHKKDIRQVSGRTKEEVRQLAALLVSKYKDPKGVLSFRTALKEYIEIKEAVLSPATILLYERMQKMLTEICPWLMSLDIHEIGRAEQQKMVSALSDKGYAVSTVKTINSLVASVLKNNELTPHRVKFNEGADTTSESDRYIPDEDVIKRLIEDVRGTDLEPAVLLAAFGPLRRGEIGGLTWEDFDFTNNTVNVHRAAVRCSSNEYVIKAPKTTASKRVVDFPAWVMERIREHEEILPMTINVLTLRFHRFLKEHGYTSFRFHDLRHFAASYYLKEGIPETSVQRRGGWATPSMLQTVYRHELGKKEADRKILASIDKFNA